MSGDAGPRKDGRKRGAGDVERWVLGRREEGGNGRRGKPTCRARLDRSTARPVRLRPSVEMRGVAGWSVTRGMRSTPALMAAQKQRRPPPPPKRRWEKLPASETAGATPSYAEPCQALAGGFLC